LADALADAEFKLKEDLIAARKDAGLEQKDVAEEMGVDKSTISRFERLDSNPTLSMLRNYAYEVGAVVTYSVVPIEEHINRQRLARFMPGISLSTSAELAGASWVVRRVLPGVVVYDFRGPSLHSPFPTRETAAPKTTVTTIQDVHI
jgi:transcriptional regulator with XRE-family HTH domain